VLGHENLRKNGDKVLSVLIFGRFASGDRDTIIIAQKPGWGRVGFDAVMEGKIPALVGNKTQSFSS
jgi:hypothetical protein